MIRSNGSLCLAFALALAATPVLAQETDRKPDSPAVDGKNVLIEQSREVTERVDENLQRTEQASDYIRALSRGETVDPLPEDDAPIERLPEIQHPVGDDPDALAASLFTDYFNRAIAIQNRYREDLNAVPIGQLLSPSSFTDPSGFDRAHQRMAEVRAAFARMSSNLRTSTLMFATTVRKSDLPPSEIAGFNRSFRDGADVETAIKHEADVLDQISVIVDLIVRERPKASDDMFLFETDEAVEAYNAELARMADLLDKQAQFARQQQAQQEAATQRLRQAR